MTPPKAHDWINTLAPYVPGRSHVAGVKHVVKISANESAFGPSPKAVKAFQENAEKLMRYPDGGSNDLREAIAGVHNLDVDQVICGAGSDDILTLLIHSYTGPGDQVIFSKYGFAVYPIQTQAAGATGIAVPNKADFSVDVDGLLTAVTPQTKLIFIDNPNNPTGTYVPWAEIERLHAALPSEVILVLDGAYAECVTADDYQAGEALVARAENVIMTRTFSKIYGLASLRVGWAYGSASIIDTLNRVRMPFNVCLPGAAAATAAVKDQDYLEKAAGFNAVWRAWLAAGFKALGLDVVDSQANFLLVGFPDEAPFTAGECYEYLTKNGYLVRAFGDLPNHLRISVGLEQENRGVLELIRAFMNGSPEEE